MGVESSSLRGRVVFVQGAPRSGTSLLTILLATHPEIAGLESESHLFEFGVDRLFDNFEGRDPEHEGALHSFLKRDQLVDAVRDLCDSIFVAMREYVGGPETAMVVEKTPTSARYGSLDLRRKRECYPDAWYLHIIRDGDAVARSLMKAPWMHDRSFKACYESWSKSVEFTRSALGDLPRYRELRFEDLANDPEATMAGVWDWLGVRSDVEVSKRVRSLSRERFSELGAPAGPSRAGAVGRARQLVTIAKHAVTGKLDALSDRGDHRSEQAKLSLGLIGALRDRNETALRECTADSLSLAYLHPDGDLIAHADEARAALLELSFETFARRHVRERWISTSGMREWWNSGHGHPLSTVFFTGIDGNSRRVDMAFALTPREGRIAEVVIITAGAARGRPLLERPGPAGASG